MELGVIVLVIIGGLLLLIEIEKLKKQVKSQKKQIDTICNRLEINSWQHIIYLKRIKNIFFILKIVVRK